MVIHYRQGQGVLRTVLARGAEPATERIYKGSRKQATMSARLDRGADPIRPTTSRRCGSWKASTRFVVSPRPGSTMGSIAATSRSNRYGSRARSRRSVMRVGGTRVWQRVRYDTDRRRSIILGAAGGFTRVGHLRQHVKRRQQRAGIGLLQCWRCGRVLRCPAEALADTTASCAGSGDCRTRSCCAVIIYSCCTRGVMAGTYWMAEAPVPMDATLSPVRSWS